jgi:hypothetical protein
MTRITALKKGMGVNKMSWDASPRRPVIFFARVNRLRQPLWLIRFLSGYNRTSALCAIQVITKSQPFAKHYSFCAPSIQKEEL